MPGVREFFESLMSLFQAAGTAAAGMRSNKAKKPKQPQTFRGGGRGTVDLNNYDPKTANKDAQRGGNAAALKNMDITANLNAKIAKMKKKEPPKLAGRSSSCLHNAKVGVQPKMTLKKF